MSDSPSFWTSPSTVQRFSLVGLVLLMLLALWQAMQLWAFSLDDAYISLTYAKNVVAGKGFVFNPGEKVEGFSNPLWVLLLAMGGMIGIPMVAWAKVLGTAAMLGTLFLCWRLTTLWIQEMPAEKTIDLEAPKKKRRKGKNSEENVAKEPEMTVEKGRLLVLLPVLVAGWWLVNPGVTYYAVAGLETILTTFLLTSALFLHFRDKGEGAIAWYALPLGLAALTRPEVVVFVGALCGWRLLQALPEVEGKGIGAQFKALPRREWLSFGLAFLPFAGWMLFRLVYFGDIFPNTYYAKPSTFWSRPGLGVQYVLGFFSHYAGSIVAKTPKNAGFHGFASLVGGITGLMLGFFLLRSLFQRAQWKRVLPLVLMVLLGCLFALYTGGDWMTHHRFFQPILPLFFLLVGVGLMTLPLKKQRLWLWGLGLLLLWQSPRLPFFASALKGNRQLDHAHRSDNNLKIAQWLKKNVPAGKSVLTDEIGAIGYVSNLKVLDFWGLVDRRVGRILHNKRFNPYSTPAFAAKRTLVQGMIARELLQRKPEYILLDYQGPVPRNAAALEKRRIHPITMKQLFAQMGSNYSYVRGFSLMTAPYKTFVLFKRNQ